MRLISRSVLATAIAVALLASALGAVSSPASAAVPTPAAADTARLLGYMWGDGSYEDGVWDVNGPSGTSSLIEELVEAHGGVWTNRAKLKFTLPAPYDWGAWKDGLPDDSADVRAAVQSPHFLAALMETEASVGGQIYDQSICCVPGYTRGRLIELRDLLRDRGFSSATLVEFGNVDSGKITVASPEWDELRVQHRFVCPAQNSDIRLPGGSDYARYGNIQWFDSQTRWSGLVRNDCVEGQTIPIVTAPVGSCVVEADGVGGARIDWTFTLGDAVIRRDGSYLTTVSGRDGSFTDRPADGTYSYQVRLLAFGERTTESCGTVTIGGQAAGSCTVSAVAGGVRLDWDDFGKQRYSIRLNGGWVAQVTNGQTSLTLGTGSLGDSWTLRYRQNGSNVNVPCTSGEPVDGPCSTTAIAGGVRVDWDAVAGVDRFQVRRNGDWLATVHGQSRFDHVGGALGAAYSVRYRQKGVSIDLACV